MSHARELLTTVADPNRERGPFKVYKRTDGRIVVVDRRLWTTPAWASAAVAERGTIDEASRCMDEFATREGL